MSDTALELNEPVTESGALDKVVTLEIVDTWKELLSVKIMLEKTGEAIAWPEAKTSLLDAMLSSREGRSEEEDVAIGNMIEELLEGSATAADDAKEFTGSE